MLSKAITIAARAHDGQVDKSGNPYILHPLRVMMNCESETEKICAILHDVIEDTNITFEDLKRQEFSDEIITVLDCLTKRAMRNIPVQFDYWITGNMKYSIFLKIIIRRLYHLKHSKQCRLKRLAGVM